MIALWVSFATAFALGAPPKVPGLPDRFECGVYELSGLLRPAQPDGLLLEIYPGTTRSFDVAVSGITFSDETSWSGRHVRAEVFIFVPGSGGAVRGRVTRSLQGIPKSEALEKPVKLVRKARCDSR